MSGLYTARCVSCTFLRTDTWQLTKLSAHWHEGDGHRVQVYPAGPTIAPLPRDLRALHTQQAKTPTSPIGQSAAEPLATEKP